VAAKQLRAVAARAKKVASRRLKFQKSRNRAFKEAFSLRERTRWILEREAERRRPAEAVAKLASATGISTARLHVLIFGAGSEAQYTRSQDASHVSVSREEFDEYGCDAMSSLFKQHFVCGAVEGSRALEWIVKQLDEGAWRMAIRRVTVVGDEIESGGGEIESGSVDTYEQRFA
jgi:hypothetical protein